MLLRQVTGSMRYDAPSVTRPEAGAFQPSRGLGKVWTRCGIAPCPQVQGQHPVFHSLALLGDLKAQGKQTLVLPCPLTVRERGRSAPGGEESHSPP